MKIGIITAMSSEQKQVAQLLENKKEYTEGPFQYTEGSIRNNTIILMKCGIGKVNAAAGTVELIRTFQPDCVISTGVAGGPEYCWPHQSNHPSYSCILSGFPFRSWVHR